MNPTPEPCRPFPAMDQFMADCKVALDKFGLPAPQIAYSPETGNPMVIVDTSKMRPKLERVYRQIYNLADKYNIPAFVVPASAVGGHMGDTYFT